MSESTMTIDFLGNKFWRNSLGQYHRTDGPAVEWEDGYKAWYVDGERLGYGNEGFWALWDTLTPKQKRDPTLLSYLPGDFNV